MLYSCLIHCCCVSSMYHRSCGAQEMGKVSCMACICVHHFCACREDHKLKHHQVSRSCCVSYRPANFTVGSGSGPAANIIVADVEASRVSLASLPVMLNALSLSSTQLFWSCNMTSAHKQLHNSQGDSVLASSKNEECSIDLAAAVLLQSCSLKCSSAMHLHWQSSSTSAQTVHSRRGPCTHVIA